MECNVTYIPCTGKNKDCSFYKEFFQECKPQNVDTFDISGIDQEVIIKFLSSPFFSWIRFKRIYLRNNGITKLDAKWGIFNKSFELLDLRHNNINNLNVSTVFSKIKNFFF